MSSSVSAHSSSHVSGSNPAGSGTSRSNSSQSSRSIASSASVARRIVHGVVSHPGQQVVGGQVLERVEARAELGHLDTVEIVGRLAEREVAGGPRARPREVAREEPLGGPRAEAAQRGDPRAHLVVVERGEPVEVEVAARERRPRTRPCAA